MRHGAFIASLLVVVVFAGACASTTPGTASSGGEAGAKIVDAAWVAAIKANNLDAVMKCYADDAILWLPDAPAARGAKQIRDAYAGLLAANTVRDAALIDVTYRSVGDSSVAWGRFSLTLAPKAGGNPVTLTGRFTEVAERRGGTWVYTVDHASADPPPAK